MKCSIFKKIDSTKGQKAFMERKQHIKLELNSIL